MRGAARLRRWRREAELLARAAAARLEVERRFRRHAAALPHGLRTADGRAGELVVSLTSYRRRFATLAPTLKCLLSQSVAAERVVLWVGAPDAAHLPGAVRALERFGLTVRTTEDIGPFTKIIPSLEAYPDAFLATADDDVYYRPDWLAELVRGFDPAAPAIVCHRAHRVGVDGTGRPLGYRQWGWEVPERETSPTLMPTGVGGVLYFPGALPPETLDRATFLALCPKADDLWLYWMERRAGRAITTLGHRRPLLTWPRSQGFGLNVANVDGTTNNDTYAGRLFDTFGLPFPGVAP